MHRAVPCCALQVPGDELDALLLMRQQVENSALPSALKRSELITGPGWDELLLDVKRTVKVCVCV